MEGQAGVGAERAGSFLPAFPSKRAERVGQPSAKCGVHIVRVPAAESLPGERIGTEVADLSSCDAEGAAVDGEPAT